jgi:hypothetical protein
LPTSASESVINCATGQSRKGERAARRLRCGFRQALLRFALRAQRHEAIQQRAERAEQQEPEQHAEPAPQRATEHGFDKRAAIQRGAFAFGEQALRRLAARGGIAGVGHRVHVVVEIARTPGVEQHRQREQEREQPIEAVAQRQLHQRDEQQRRPDREEQPDAAAPAGVVAELRGKPFEPADEPVVAAQRHQRRHRVADDERDDDGDERDGHRRPRIGHRMQGPASQRIVRNHSPRVQRVTVASQV